MYGLPWLSAFHKHFGFWRPSFTTAQPWGLRKYLLGRLSIHQADVVAVIQPVKRIQAMGAQFGDRTKPSEVCKRPLTKPLSQLDWMPLSLSF